MMDLRDDVLELGFLPLAHIFEVSVFYFLLAVIYSFPL